jgi:hypothetical protein
MGFLEVGDRNRQVRVQGFHQAMPRQFHKVPMVRLMFSHLPLQAMRRAGGPRGVDALVRPCPRLLRASLEPQPQYAPANLALPLTQEYVLHPVFPTWVSEGPWKLPLE